MPTRNGSKIKREIGIGLSKKPKKLSCMDWEFDKENVTKNKMVRAKKTVFKKFLMVTYLLF